MVWSGGGIRLRDGISSTGRRKFFSLRPVSVTRMRRGAGRRKRSGSALRGAALGKYCGAGLVFGRADPAEPCGRTGHALYRRAAASQRRGDLRTTWKRRFSFADMEPTVKPTSPRLVRPIIFFATDHRPSIIRRLADTSGIFRDDLPYFGRQVPVCAVGVCVAL